jgi:protein SCO1/2
MKGLSILLASLVLASTALAAEHHQHGKELPSAAPSSQSVFQLGSRWKDSQGRKVKLAELGGMPLVVAMVYTSCQAACPMTVADLRRIEKGLPEDLRKHVRFVLVSFDPARDTPAKLRRFGEAHDLRAPQWRLLTGSESDVRDLAAVLGVQYRSDGKGDFVHSNLIHVLGPDGVIKHVQSGLGQSPDESVRVLKELLVSTQER